MIGITLWETAKKISGDLDHPIKWLDRVLRGNIRGCSHIERAEKQLYRKWLIEKRGFVIKFQCLFYCNKRKFISVFGKAICLSCLNATWLKKMALTKDKMAAGRVNCLQL